MRSRGQSAAGALLLPFLLAAAGIAAAHGFLVRAEPRAGSTVRTPPAQVRLWFGERLEPAFSTVRVLDGAGRQVDLGNVSLDPQDAKLLRVSLPPLPAGTCRVVWRVLSVDTHVTEGEFTFRVAP
jgi:methionine-rich copper-binding protein CopC